MQLKSVNNTEVAEKEAGEIDIKDPMEMKGIKGMLEKMQQASKQNKKNEEQEELLEELEPNSKQAIANIPLVMQECWRMFRGRFMESEEVRETIKNESTHLSSTIWKISEMFQDDVKVDCRDLLICNSDIIVKILVYLQFWRTNGASRSNVIFILRVLSAILKDSMGEGDEELISRQNLYD